jgi:hypothetical protein
MEKPGTLLVVNENGGTEMAWRPISELTKETRYGTEEGFWLCAPELVDLDCNPHGVAPGYWQDDAGSTAADADAGGCWLGAGYDMSNEEWVAVECHPTHFMRVRGPLR